MKKTAGFVWIAAAVVSLNAVTASAAELSFSGFGTLGYAVSDRGVNYQRFVNREGTFSLDSVLGAQVDVKLNNEFSLTVQGKLAASQNRDNGVDPTLTWAFLSWRPSNDWLIRAGRIRAPFYLNSQNLEVGTTFDFARLPLEVYSTAQTNDGDGILVSKSWNVDANEFSLDGYFGTSETNYRYYLRDGVPSVGLAPGAHFGTSRMTGGGLTVTLHRADDTYRIGVLKGNVRTTDGVAAPGNFPFVQLGPGVGYYQTSNLLPGPGVPSTDETPAMIYSLGADVAVGYDFRVTGEYVLRHMSNSVISPSSQSAYLAVLRPIEEWTPYVSIAWIRSPQQTLNLYNRVNGTTVPASVPNAVLINQAQVAGADAIYAFDQYTLALGTSYKINSTSKLKTEWARTQSGDVSCFIDAPPGGESGHQVINVFSFSYNFVF